MAASRRWSVATLRLPLSILDAALLHFGANSRKPFMEKLLPHPATLFSTSFSTELLICEIYSA
jgi:hypothetical protein